MLALYLGNWVNEQSNKGARANVVVHPLSRVWYALHDLLRS